MNVEQLEAELILLKGVPIFIVISLWGNSSIAFSGPLEVVTTEQHRVAFHINSPLGGWAIIFYAEDVQSLQPSNTEHFRKVIRLKKSV